MTVINLVNVQHSECIQLTIKQISMVNKGHLNLWMKSVCMNQWNKNKWEDSELSSTLTECAGAETPLFWPCGGTVYGWQAVNTLGSATIYHILLYSNNTLLINSIPEQSWAPAEKRFCGESIKYHKILLLPFHADSQGCRAVSWCGI